MADEQLTVSIPTTTTGPEAPAAPEVQATPTTPETPEAPTTPPAESEEAARTEAEQALQDKGLNITSYEQEWETEGQLSEESYKALEKAGIPKVMVDRYIEGQQALMQGFVGEVQQLAGGAEGYIAVTQWAKENLTPQEAAAYNTIVTGGDKDAIKLAVTGLVSRHRAAEGHAPTLLSGKAGASASPHDVFESTAQVTAAMRDKRYGKDPAYTRSVEEKMRRSTVFAQ